MTWQELLKRPPQRRGKVEPGNPSTLKIEAVDPPDYSPEGHLVSGEAKTAPPDEPIQLKKQVMG